MANSFYVPVSQTGSYIEQKRDASGTKLYAGQEAEIGIQKQAALQNLSEQYNQTIQNAYNSYLANQGKIRLSPMGQGYREAYEQKANEAFMQNIAQANQTAAEARSQIETSTAEQQTALQERYKQEVANLDRAAASMTDYLTYIRGLRGRTTDDSGNIIVDDTKRYFGEEYDRYSASELYDKLLDAQPQAFADLYDENNQRGLSYTEWLKEKYIKGTKEDSEWLNYMYGGGLNDFRRAAYKAAEERRETIEKNRVEGAGLEYGKTADQGGISVAEKLNNTEYKVDNTTYEIIDKETGIEQTILDAVYGTSKSRLGALSPALKDKSNINVNDFNKELTNKYDNLRVGEVISLADIDWKYSDNRNINADDIKFIKTEDGMRMLINKDLYNKIKSPDYYNDFYAGEPIKHDYVRSLRR